MGMFRLVSSFILYHKAAYVWLAFLNVDFFFIFFLYAKLDFFLEIWHFIY